MIKIPNRFKLFEGCRSLALMLLLMLAWSQVSAQTIDCGNPVRTAVPGCTNSGGVSDSVCRAWASTQGCPNSASFSCFSTTGSSLFLCGLAEGSGICGNNVLEPSNGETCDDGNVTNGDGCSSTCQIEPECTVNADCDNGTYCDGSEICNAGTCEAGTPVVCDDGAFCNGTETCNETTDSCDAGTPPACDDGLFCTGIETCNEGTDSCESPGDPCSGAECNTCQEDADSCFDPVATACGDGSDTVCSDPDTCDGAGVCQPNHATADTECRGIAGVCDVAELCDGAGLCPNDAFMPSTTVCNEGSGDACDPDEMCTGLGAECPDDVFEPSTTVCNAGTGDSCDPDELCTGVADAACPDDTVTPAGEVCRNGSGDLCDPDEVCSGNADEACPDDTVLAANTVCNAGSGDLCDQDEVCSGVAGDACPDDVFEPSTTVCNPGSGDLCDPDELCTGVADAACPDDFVEPATTVCNPSIGEEQCDPSELCTGIADATCPDDVIRPEGYACGDGSDTECTNPDTCGDEDGICYFNNQVCGSLTNSSLCEFDMEPDKGTCMDSVSLDGSACSLGTAGTCEADGGTCVQSDQFKLAFSPDMQNWVSYKQNSSNPGQFYYNLIYDASAAIDDVTVDIVVPYPFITQGANPLHVYDADLVPSNGSGCLDPQESLMSSRTVITLADWIQDGTTEPPYAAPDYLACDPVLLGETGDCVISVDIPLELIQATQSGLLYVNLHMDYGLKGPFTDADNNTLADRYDRAGFVSPWGSSDALINTDADDGPVAIADCSVYSFAHAVDTVPQLEDSAENLNLFKRAAGAFGHTACLDESPVEGYIQLEEVVGSVPVFITQIDEDGYYAAGYQHKGKAIEFQIRYCEDVGPDGSCVSPGAVTEPFYLQSNGFVQVDILEDGLCDGGSFAEISPLYSKGKFKNAP